LAQWPHHVSSSPSKIPYGGFSPVRLKIDIPPRPSRPTYASHLYADHSPPPRCHWYPFAGQSPRERGVGQRVTTNVVDPEALGSPTGCSVPPGQCLLWPHPSLWHPSARLICFVRRTLGAPEGPNFILPVLSSVPSALPRRIGWCLRRFDCHPCCLRRSSSVSASTNPTNRFASVA
jgi:hypothetical protein